MSFAHRLKAVSLSVFMSPMRLSGRNGAHGWLQRLLGRIEVLKLDVSQYLRTGMLSATFTFSSFIVPLARAVVAAFDSWANLPLLLNVAMYRVEPKCGASHT